jgi:uncharacterized protein involved in exopolysaccharide biosynthesis
VAVSLAAALAASFLALARYRAAARVQAEWADPADAGQSRVASELAERLLAVVRRQVQAAAPVERERVGAGSATVSVRPADDGCFLLETEHSDPVKAALVANRLADRLVEEAERDRREAGEERGALEARLAAARREMEEAESALARVRGSELSDADALPTLERLLRRYEEARTSYFEAETMLTAAQSPSQSFGAGRVRFRVLWAAVPPSAPLSSGPILFGVVGALVGLAAGLGLAVLAEARDRSVKGPEDLAEVLPYPILVEIPIIKGPRSARSSRRGSPEA